MIPHILNQFPTSLVYPNFKHFFPSTQIMQISKRSSPTLVTSGVYGVHTISVMYEKYSINSQVVRVTSEQEYTA